MNIDPQKVIDWLTSLNELSSIPLTFFLCLAIAIAMRLMPFVKNQLIPTVVVLAGPLILLGITDFKASPAMTVRVFVFRTGFIGFIVGTVAWLFYQYAVRPLKRKFLGENGVSKDAVADIPDPLEPSQPEQPTNEKNTPSSSANPFVSDK